jgi:mannose-6-phosphate isomerase-like protein (cupin superfamily)
MIRRVDKPWGEEIIFAQTSSYAGKLLRIRKGEALSLQYHEHKDEAFYVYEGTSRLTVGSAAKLEERTLGPGESCHLPPGTRHRIEALEETTLFEVSTPELDDVVRLEDRYGRVRPKPALDDA